MLYGGAGDTTFLGTDGFDLINGAGFNTPDYSSFGSGRLVVSLVNLNLAADRTFRPRCGRP